MGVGGRRSGSGGVDGGVVGGFVVGCGLEGFDRAVVDDVVWATRLWEGAAQGCSCSIGKLDRRGCEKCFGFPIYQVGGRCVGLDGDSSEWECEYCDLEVLWVCVCCAGEPAADPQRRRVLGSELAVVQAVGWILGRRSGSFGESAPLLQDWGFRRDFSQAHP